MWLVVSEGAKSILSIAVCWHSPYCAILPAILPDKQSRPSRGAIDGGAGAGGACTRGKAHIYEQRAHISSPAVSSPSQRWKVSRAPSRRTLSLSLFTLQSRFYSGSTTTLFDNCHRDESIWTLCRHPPPQPPVLLLSFFKQ